MNAASKIFSALQEIGNHATEGLIIFDAEKKSIIYLNDEARNITGFSEDSSHVPEDIISKVAPDDQAYIKSKFAYFWNNSFLPETEFDIKKDNGVIITVCCRAHFVLNNTHIVLFIKDISKLKQHENYLIEFGAQKNALLDTVVHNVSGALQLMKHLSVEAERSVEKSDVKNLKVYLNLLKENNKHCIDIINDLLKKEHTESPQISIKPSRVDIVNKIHLLYNNLKETYKNRNFTFSSSNKNIYVNTDEFKLLQVINNLLSNAIKFTKEENKISIDIKENDEEVIYSVSDQGIGIPEAMTPFIFDRKSRAGRAGLNGEKSIGIGLHISKKIVELMHGKIWFETIENKGSTFHFAIPKDHVQHSQHKTKNQNVNDTYI